MKYNIKNVQRQARELLLRIFYSYDQKEDNLESILNEYTRIKTIHPEVIKHAYNVISFFEKNKETVDNLIKSHLQKWRFERLGYIERAILRIAITELLILKETNKEEDLMIKRIVLDALDLVECYTGSKESVKFINGIIGKVIREMFTHHSVY